MPMRTLLSAAILLILGVILVQSGMLGKESTTSSPVNVSGKVRLVEKSSGKVDQDASGAVLWLVPLNSAEGVRADKGRRIYRIEQRNKQFHPHVLIVPVGSTVVFPNLDPWFHNVFSLYRGKRFDLGLYEAGSEKAVNFDRPGASYIFCNIHPEMMAVVLAVESPFYASSDRTGAWSIQGVTPGRYRLHVWYENATPDVLETLDREVAIGRQGTVLTTMTIQVTPHAWLHHPNLYGHPYESQELTPMY